MCAKLLNFHCRCSVMEKQMASRHGRCYWLASSLNWGFLLPHWTWWHPFFPCKFRTQTVCPHSNDTSSTGYSNTAQTGPFIFFFLSTVHCLIDACSRLVSHGFPAVWTSLNICVFLVVALFFIFQQVLLDVLSFCKSSLCRPNSSKDA